MVIAMLFGVGFMGSILYLTQFNQQVFGANATESGLMLIPMVAGIMTSSIGGGQIISRTGKYKRFMEFGIILATVMVGLLTTLTPESSYIYEAVIITLLGFGLGFVMPIMNIAVQNEFEQKELGVATSSIQTFRGLGSTVGIAVFGAMLTSGITTNLTDIQTDPYVRQLASSSAVKQIGDLSDPNTLLTINSPDIKQRITDSTESALGATPAPNREKVLQQFQHNQAEYSSKVVQAFSDSLRHIFLVSAGLMLLAGVLVFFIEERELKRASPDATPGEM